MEKQDKVKLILGVLFVALVLFLVKDMFAPSERKNIEKLTLELTTAFENGDKDRILQILSDDFELYAKSRQIDQQPEIMFDVGSLQ